MPTATATATQKKVRDDRAAALYRKYGPIIYSRCRRMLRDDALAEDAAHEVFVRVLKHIDAAPEEKAALPWLYRICSNYCLNQIRNRRRCNEALAVPNDEPVVDFERRVVERDLAQKLVERAPERLQGAAVLHFVEGMKQAQVAQVLGICRRTVIYRLSQFTDDAKRFASAV